LLGFTAMYNQSINQTIRWGLQQWKTQLINQVIKIGVIIKCTNQFIITSIGTNDPTDWSYDKSIYENL
jgi:hypothetical protein